MRGIAPITIAIPVGPADHHRRWLFEALESIAAQTLGASEVVLINDGRIPIDSGTAAMYACYRECGNVNIIDTPWRVGVASAFNFGVALAQNDLVVMLGSDDRLLPDCLKQCWYAWQTHKDTLGYYYLGVEYASNGSIQNLPCNAAMVHKDLWELTGGFPPESAIGMCDHFITGLIQLGNGRFGRQYSVYDTCQEAQYWYRDHEETDSAQRRGDWHNLAMAARNLWIDSKLQAP